MYIIAGLGNPGKKFELTRHNAGRIVLNFFANIDIYNFYKWEENKKKKVLYTEGDVNKNRVGLVLPETFMNNSGNAILFIKNKYKVKTKNIIIIYDDLDLPLGTFKISFNKNSGGHKGLDSIIKSLKTKEFARIRVGISPVTPSGKIKKPKGEKKVLDWVMKDFKKQELVALEKLSVHIDKALQTIMQEGRDKAMNKFN